MNNLIQLVFTRVRWFSVIDKYDIALMQLFDQVVLIFNKSIRTLLQYISRLK